MANVSGVLYYGAPLTPDGPHDDWLIDAVSRPPEILTNFRKVPVEVEITDLRDASVQPELDQMGFERLVCPTRADQQAISEQSAAALSGYQQETAALLEARTGADAVVVFDATVRREDADCPDHGPNQSAHQRVHVDQNPSSARARAARHGAGRRFRRFQIVNVWRPLIAPVRNFPLAVCDYRTVDVAGDLVVTRLRFPAWLADRENFSVRYNPSHRWYYWRGLAPDEVMVFKCFDSASAGLAGVSEGAGAPGSLDVSGLCPHTAFVDPDGPTTGRLRTSVELRALVLYS